MALRALAFGNLAPGQSQAFRGVPGTGSAAAPTPDFSALPADEGDTTDLTLPSMNAVARTQAAFATTQQAPGAGASGGVPFGATDDPNNFLNKLAELPGFQDAPAPDAAAPSQASVPPVPSDAQTEATKQTQGLQRLAGGEAPTSDQGNSEGLAVISGLKKGKQALEQGSKFSDALAPDLGTRATGTGSELTPGGSLSDIVRGPAPATAGGIGSISAGELGVAEREITDFLERMGGAAAGGGGGGAGAAGMPLADALGSAGLSGGLESLGGLAGVGGAASMMLPIILSFFQGDDAFKLPFSGGDRRPSILHDQQQDFKALPTLMQQMQAGYVDPGLESTMSPEELRGLYGNALTGYGALDRFAEIAGKSGSKAEGIQYPDVSGAIEAAGKMSPVIRFNMVSALDRLARLGGDQPYAPGDGNTNYEQGIPFGEALHALSGLAGLPTYGPEQRTAISAWDPRYKDSPIVDRSYSDQEGLHQQMGPASNPAEYLSAIGADPALADRLGPGLDMTDETQGNYLARLVPLMQQLNPNFGGSELAKWLGRPGVADLLTPSATTRRPMRGLPALAAAPQSLLDIGTGGA